ncbi:amidohydrolase family protein [Microbacterium thalassium]|uniref:5-methylthioadenosine/S-adenosylhomocysteine deaminase n=1 Tax=Microbacterium thalassium TaxID=362649 RepID=A0A7X0FN25_9MICO|nr:amidohydrolase family protein [Microbacterium thalassium]MBB6390538.1 5-methylthioadenosine/S-adenosylhomocysteine deaminase [Microbacterium thalassium]GLK25649.1 5-methylthioadenosine/S-adenosylhomocysteine deaminase [Microbacterium thalassium]
MTRIAIRGGTIIAATGETSGDLLIEDDTIVSVGPTVRGSVDVDLDGTGSIVSPGFVQSHVHLCQTAFSGLAEDLDVMQWLDRWVWPLEQLLDADDLAISARWGVAELLLSGTTSFLSMESAHHTDRAFEAAADLGARATIGKALMDRREPGTSLVAESTEEAWSDLLRLMRTWHDGDERRLRVAVSPRSPSAATPQLWADALELAIRMDAVVHTHVNENHAQAHGVAEVNAARDVRYLDELGALTRRTVLAHGVWLDDDEVSRIARTGASIAHCPSANLKLGSGIADVPRLVAAGVNVGLGADGAACNNTLDARAEMRLAALVHRRGGDASAITAESAFAFATVNGARALGLGPRVGSLRPGMKADVAVFDAPQFSAGTGESARDHLVFSGSAARARTVLVDGRIVVDDFGLTRDDQARIRREGAAVRASLARRLSVPSLARR